MKLKLSKSTANFFLMTIASSAMVYLIMTLIVKMLKNTWP
jgi:hypothetical protein